MPLIKVLIFLLLKIARGYWNVLSKKMLSKGQLKRPNIKEIQHVFSERCKVELPKEAAPSGSKLRGPGLKIAKPKDETAERIDRVKSVLKIGKGLKILI